LQSIKSQKAGKPIVNKQQVVYREEKYYQDILSSDYDEKIKLTKSILQELYGILSMEFTDVLSRESSQSEIY